MLDLTIIFILAILFSVATILGFLSLLWACDRSYYLGVRDCLKQLREQGFSVPTDIVLVEALKKKE